jgi:hypothetical protein
VATTLRFMVVVVVMTAGMLVVMVGVGDGGC